MTIFNSVKRKIRKTIKKNGGGRRANNAFSAKSPQSTLVPSRILTYNNSNPPIHKTITYYPDQQRIVMRYNTTIVISGASSLSQNYRGNSIFDPDLTGTGTQPLYYDQLSVIYAKYCVLGSRITICAANGSGNSVNVVVFPSKDTSYSGAIYDRNQQQRASYGVVSPNSGSNNQCFLETSDTTARIFALMYPQDEDNYCALVGNNPTNSWNHLFYAQTFDASTIALYLNVTIDYDVLWSRRNSLYDA